VADFEFDHVPTITALVEKEKIDCDFTLTKSFDIYTENEVAESAKNSYEELKAAGIAKNTIDDLVWTDAEDAEEVKCFSKIMFILPTEAADIRREALRWLLHLHCSPSVAV
jgi:hypothetical protein